jgi:hypothetical protein
MRHARRLPVSVIAVVAFVVGFIPAAVARGAAAADTASTAPGDVTDDAVDAVDAVDAQDGASSDGYWMVARDGGIFSFGSAAFHGSTGAMTLNRPIVGMASTPSGNGYWMVASDGGIFSFGDAAFHGSTGAMTLNRPIVGMAATPSGNGYWFVASDGGIFSFGDAGFHGSTGSLTLNQPIVGMAATPSGNGYWFVASDGGIFSFGDAAFRGSTGAMTLNRPIVGMAATPSGNGYWFVASDGGIFSFGDAVFHGSTGGISLNQPIVGMAAVAVPPVIPPPATRLAFTRQPSDSTGGVAFASQPAVTVQDASGATVTSNTSSIRLTITSPAGARLSCKNGGLLRAIAGVARFAGCKIDLAGNYTLRATAGALTSATSNTLTISVGGAARLGFTTSPSGAASSVAFGTQPVVAVQDLGGNRVSTVNTGSVTLIITQPSTPSTAALTCTNATVAVTAGVATFAGCRIDLSGLYTLRATGGGLTAATSRTLSITSAAATKLVFTTSPNAATGGVAFAAQPVVKVEDVAGNTVTTDASGVTLTITTPNGALLSCTNATPLQTVYGVATFTGCKIDRAGAYTLHAVDGSLTSATSLAFTISVGAAAKIGFTASPNASTGGVASTTQPVVAVQDLGGNTVTTTNTGTVALTITQPSTPAGAALTCTNATVAVSAGVATFVGCKIDLAGTYTLHAVDGGFTATSLSFAITTGAAANIGFTTSPNASTGGVAFTTQPVVAVQDLGGNTVTTTNTGTVALTITQPSTPSGAALTCTNATVAVSAGIATFAGCKIDLAGTYTLHAVDGGFTATSLSVTISVGAAANITFTTSPSGSTGGVAFGAQPIVAVQDLGGNTVTTDGSGVTLTITAPGGALLNCTNASPLPAVNGVATFTGCKIDLAGTYTLHAADGGFTATSNSFTISVGTAARLGFTTSPNSTTGGTAFTSQPVVAIQDLGGNTVTTASTSVTLTITQPSTPANASLTCTNASPRATAAGVATFTGCKVDLSGTYSLHATDGVLTTATSNTFGITVGLAAKLKFTTSPTGTTTNTAFPVQPVVTVQDLGGNTVVSDNSSVTLTITTSAGASLTCTNATPLPAVNGVATFTGCRINLANTYTLDATDSTLTADTSSSFVISP